MTSMVMAERRRVAGFSGSGPVSGSSGTRDLKASECSSTPNPTTVEATRASRWPRTCPAFVIRRIGVVEVASGASAFRSASSAAPDRHRSRSRCTPCTQRPSAANARSRRPRPDEAPRMSALSAVSPLPGLSSSW